VIAKKPISTEPGEEPVSLEDVCLYGPNVRRRRGHVKASRPLIRVLVINDNHCGLTFLLRYKNRLVR
jgi:hypothetical protein